jgi:hypothetical protein
MEFEDYMQVRGKRWIETHMNKKYWPYHVAIKETEYSVHVRSDDAERWCYQKFKSRNWRNLGNYFAFKREQDVMMFILRWL